MKNCSVCKTAKELTEYYKNKKCTGGLSPHCKDCNKLKDRLPANRYSRLRAQCRRFDKPLGISLEEYTELVSKPCHYCALPIGETTGAAMDRLDRTLGYEAGNCVPCCWLCNFTKGTTFNEQEMKDIGALFAGFHERRKQLGQEPIHAPYGGKDSKPRTPGYWKESKQYKKQRGWDHLRENG